MRILLLVFLLALAGCSTVESRIKKNPEAFNRLSEKQKALVLQGEIDEGMSTDAVLLAWGRPDIVAKGRERGNAVEDWIYEGVTSEYVGSYRAAPVTYRGRRGGYYRTWDYVFDPVLVSYSYPYKTVRFEEGEAVGWRLLPRRW